MGCASLIRTVALKLGELKSLIAIALFGEGIV